MAARNAILPLGTLSLLFFVLLGASEAWVAPRTAATRPAARKTIRLKTASGTTKNTEDDEEQRLVNISRSWDDNDDDSRTSFSDAGSSLMDIADQKRMEDMGDFDDNPAVRQFFFSK
jgi:hypothetical protein